ncbi:hypothetical protein ACP8HI_13450 [Paenibacillus sp. FA6]|uniref:hypothetical protein n=1 Tax=Paenibacillus sp. FA6 TaxID=3413029 RepID=UPI003F6599C7
MKRNAKELQELLHELTTDAIQLAIRAGTLEALSLENDNQRDETNSDSKYTKLSEDKRKPLSLEELPAHLTAKNIHEFTNISLRKVYELMNMNPEYGGIPSFRIGSKSLLSDRDEFLQWWDKEKEKGRRVWPSN